jgi:hypothetical protein
MPDITESLTPKSTQLDAVDLANGPRTFTVERADYRPGAEQPVTVHLVEIDRPWKPGKNMRRVLAACWTKDTDAWAGRRVTLFCDPDVVFAGAEVGGIRISHMDVEKPTKVPIIPTKGKAAMYPVQVLKEAPQPRQRPTPDPMAVMGAGMKARGMVDKEDALAYVESIIGRAVASRDEMTPEEVAQVNEALAVPIEEAAQ